MKLTIQSLSHKPLEFSKDLPLKYPGPRLPGGEVLSATGAFGDLCVQEFDGGNFTMRYSLVQTSESFQIDVQSHHSGLHTVIMLRNNITPVFKTGEQIRIDENQFTIINAHQPVATLQFPGHQHFICFEVMLSNELALSILNDFPGLQKSVERTQPGPPGIWVNPSRHTDEEVREHIRYILTYSDPVKWRRNYFENRVWDIVWKLVMLYLDRPPLAHVQTKEDTAKAYALQRLIINNLDKHLLIRDLAKEVGSSESKIKRIFSEIFGMGMHKYRIYHRLQKAIKLLNEGKLVKEAAAETGWRPADLIKAYYKVYGTTPGSAKKKN